MSQDAHIVVKKEKGKEILEVGHWKADIEMRNDTFCLTKPWESGSMISSQLHGWTIFNLKTKDEIVQFKKRKDAVAYYEFLTRQ